MAKQEKITPQQALESIYGLMKLLEVEQLNKLLTAVGKIPEKINVNATLAERDRNLFKEVRDQYEAANRRFAEFCKLVSSKKAWFLYLFLTTSLSAGTTFLIAEELINNLKTAVKRCDNGEDIADLVNRVCDYLKMPMLKENPLFARTIACLREERL